MRPLTELEYRALNELMEKDFAWGHKLFEQLKRRPPSWVVSNPLALGGTLAVPIIQGMLDRVARVFRAMPTRAGQPFPRMDRNLRDFMVDFFRLDIEYWRQLGVDRTKVDAFERALYVVSRLPS